MIKLNKEEQQRYFQYCKWNNSDWYWHERMLDLACHISTWSKDPSTKVGAVITDPDHRIVSVGYNGFPKGVDDSPERLNDRVLKYPMTVHAEQNAILFAKRDLKDCWLYCYPFMPCATCAATIIQSGIKLVMAPWSDNERWIENFELAATMFDEANVSLRLTFPE